MAYQDNLNLENSAHNDLPADQFGEHIYMASDSAEDDEQLVPDEATEDEAPANAFRERIGQENNHYDDDFTRSLDADENPYIGDQLDDENLQREAENEYR
jgi:hypothetical protein